MEFLDTLLNVTDKFLTIGSSYYGTVSRMALDMYQMDAQFKMNQLQVSSLNKAAEASIQQADLQFKEYEIERINSQTQSLQTYENRMAEFNEAAELNSFLTESRLGGGESMSVRRFMQKQAETVARDASRINDQAIQIDSALARQGHMSMLNGLYAAKAQRQQALVTAYQGTIDMLETTPNPFESAKDVTGGIRTIADMISEGLKP